ncbi:MAG: TetR/AcrR family transcriptional regulator [Promethearchaeota archaeon]
MNQKRESRSERLKKIRREKERLYLLSAIHIFEEKGYNHARVRDITERAGTSVGNFYRYFESKEEIFKKVIHQFYTLMVEKLKVLNEEPIPKISSIKKLFHDYLKIFKENKKIALIFIEQMGGINKKYKNKKNEYVDDFSCEVEKIISRLVELGAARPQNAQITARIWTATFLEIFHWWLRLEEKIDEKELVDNMTNFLVKGTMGK